MGGRLLHHGRGDVAIEEVVTLTGGTGRLAAWVTKCLLMQEGSATVPIMDTNTLLIIVVVLLLLGGGGFFFRGRR